MKTNPSDVYILQRIDSLNASTHNEGVTEASILDGVESEFLNDVRLAITALKNAGVLEIRGIDPVKYRLSGRSEHTSEEVKHYVRNRKIPH